MSETIRILTKRQTSVLEYLEQHPTIYAGTIKSVGWATLDMLRGLSYIEQNPSSPLGNFRITPRGRHYMSLHRLREISKHIRRGDEVQW